MAEPVDHLDTIGHYFHLSVHNIFIIVSCAVFALLVHTYKFNRKVKSSVVCEDTESAEKLKKCRVLFASKTGTSRRLTDQLSKSLRETKEIVNNYDILSNSLKDFEPEDLFTDAVQKSLVIIIISTHSGGNPAPDGTWFYKWLEECVNDFRINKTSLKGLRYCVIGVGDKAYGQDFCLSAKNVYKWLKQLDAIPVYLHLADVGDQEFYTSFKRWTNMLLLNVLNDKQYLNNIYEDEANEQKIVDIEDIVDNKAMNTKNGPKHMITTELRKELTKQGYKLIGSHSGVKLCRWTKSMLRGRGISMIVWLLLN